MSKEWYLYAYMHKEYLHNKVLLFRPFTCDEGDHDHCEVCWARFSRHPSDLQGGYYEPLSDSWICPDCYNELSSKFGWSVK